MIDGKDLNPEWIEKHVRENQKIMLIKALRQVSGMGLKDSKDAIEAYWDNVSADAIEAYWDNVSATQNLFARYMIPAEEREAEARRIAEEEARLYEEKKKEIDNEGTKTILKGIKCVCNHWRTLGFNSKITGCLSILNNLKDNVPDLI